MQLPFTKSYLKKLGEKIRHKMPLSEEEEKNFSLYRAAHNKIMCNFRNKLTKQKNEKQFKSKQIIVAQRLKKRETITNKLSSRFSEMDLTQLHDIAGARIIFSDLETLYKFRSAFNGKKLKRYKRVSNEKYDYISHMKDSGYRGIHDVFEEDGNEPIKAKIEIQYRTRVMHSWATALEIWDSYYDGETKFGKSSGDIPLLFKFISELFSRKIEKKINLKNYTDLKLLFYIYYLNFKTGLIRKLIEIKKLKNAEYKNNKEEAILIKKRIKYLNEFKITLDFSENREINKDAIEFILRNYFEIERDADNDAVFVNVSGGFFEEAYNNYYNDLSRFFSNLRKSIDRIENEHKFFSFVLHFFFGRLFSNKRN